MISAQGIHKAFGGNEVLRGVSGRCVGEVVGRDRPVRLGKSTFALPLNHLETIDRGTISIEGGCWRRSEERGQGSVCERCRNPARSAARWAWCFQSLQSVSPSHGAGKHHRGAVIVKA